MTFRAWKKERGEIDQELALKSAPKVYLRYETYLPIGIDERRLQDRFSVRCTDANAVNIAFDPCELDGRQITFRPIAQMSANDSRPVTCLAATVDQEFCDFLSTACQKDGKSEMPVKIRITYGDGAGGKFETVSTITYDAQKRTAVTKIDGPKLVQ